MKKTIEETVKREVLVCDFCHEEIVHYADAIPAHREIGDKHVHGGCVNELIFDYFAK